MENGRIAQPESATISHSTPASAECQIVRRVLRFFRTASPSRFERKQVISIQTRQTGAIVKIGAIATALAVVLAVAAPAAADIKPPLWTATPLPESANEPGTISVTGSGCGPSGAVIFSHDFAIDGDPGEAVTGQEWISDSNGTWEVSDFALNYSSADANLGYLVADTGFPDARMSFIVTEIPETFWAVFRYRDPSNHYRFGRDDGGSYQFQKVENGVTQGFAPFGRDITPREGDRIDINYEADDSINVYRDDDWLYGDGLLFNITETSIGFASGDSSIDATGTTFKISDLEVVPYSGIPVTAAVQVNAATGGVIVSTIDVSPDNDGNWTSRLEVPIQSGTGDYTLTAVCSTPGYQITYSDLSTRVNFAASAELITDFVAEVDFASVEDSPTLDPVTTAVIVMLAVSALGLLILGGFAARRLSDSRET